MSYTLLNLNYILFFQAKHHLLVLPKADIKNPYQLREEHIPLLQKMEERGREIAQQWVYMLSAEMQ